jgi:anaerobic magnesium-protoporphyrin IX monomethyl ester cyclase
VKITLVVPGSRAAVDNARYRELFPQLLPMSVAYLAAVLEEAGHETSIIDQVPARLDNRGLVSRIIEEQPDAVGVSLLTTTVEHALEMVGLLREQQPELPIIAGNQHASMFADDLLLHRAVDYVVRGEGEATIIELAKALEDGTAVHEILGLSYRRGEAVVHNPDRPILADLDTLPYPAWHRVDLFNPSYMELPVIGVYSTPLAIMASRGCPFGCVYCSQDKQYKKVRLRKVEKVVDEIEAHVDRYGVEWLTFNDAYFPWNRRQGLAFADEMIRRGLHKRVRWTTESRVDRVDYELLKRLKESGLEVIFFGFESGSQAVLDRAGKGTTLEQARMAASAARKAGVAVMGFFMLGLPGDTVGSCWETVKFAMELDCDFAKFAITVPYPGSALYEDLRGQIDGQQFEKFTSWYSWAAGGGELIYSPDGMTVQELVSVQRLGMLRFYARPTQVFRHLRRGTIRPKAMALGATVLLEGAAQSVMDRVRSIFSQR